MPFYFRKFLLILPVIISLYTANIFACEDGYCDYSGAYSTGGYALLDLTIDISTITNYASADSGFYGGGCGSLISSCNSCYDTALTSGYAGQNSFYNSSLIDSQIQQAINQINQIMAQPNIPSYPPYPSYPSFPMYPYNPPPTGYPPVTNYPLVVQSVPNINPSNVPYTFPTFPNPVSQVIPTGTGSFPTIPTIPPYGGCDGVIIPCPNGPIRLNPPTTYQPPVVTPSNNQINTSPMRYRVPRGVTTH